MFSCDTLKTSSSYGNPVQCVSGTKHYCALRSPQRSNSNPKSNCVEITPSKITPPPPPPSPGDLTTMLMNLLESPHRAQTAIEPQSNRNRTAVKLHWNRIETAPECMCLFLRIFPIQISWNCSETALKPHWNRTETALKPPLNTWIRWCEFRQNLSVFNF